MRYLNVPYFKQDTLYTCGPTALQMVLAFYGMRASERDLREELAAHPETGTARERMIKAVRTRGFYSYVNDGSSLDELAYLAERNVPIIVRFLERAINEDHYGVVVGVNGDMVAVHDPWHGPFVEFPSREFDTRWTCDTLGTCEKWLMAVSQQPFEIGRQYHPL